jgi:protoheme IX farnesyltransferase
MRTATLVIDPLAGPAVPAAVRSRLADYVELTKPKIAAMALVTVAGGFLLGAGARPSGELLLHTLIGTALVAAGGSALNHWLERRSDARMVRTLNRPLPAGRMNASDVLAFGLTLAVVGVAYLAVAVPHWQAAVAAAATGFLYVAVYTPLKRVTAWNTVVGAVPGALPPVIGWCAAHGDLTLTAVALFLILFIWQLPHFYSIAWLHRADYARGGMRMLPNVDRPDGRWTGVATVGTAVLLLAAGATPYLWAGAGPVYLVGSGALGAWFLARCVRFARGRTDRTARGVLRGSLVYLLGVTGLMVASCRPADDVQIPPTPLVADLDFPVPAFALTERSGRTVTDADLRGKVWVASFVFTRCTGSCPAVTATVARLQERLKGRPDVRLVTFTVDPERDTPDELKKYADRYRADPERWLFLTGKEADIHKLAAEGFKFATGRNAVREPGQEEFLHTRKLAVVDKRGVIRRVFDGMATGETAEANLAESIGKVVETVERLEKE